VGKRHPPGSAKFQVVKDPAGVTFEVGSAVASEAINELRAAAWPNVGAQDWDAVLATSLGWVTAHLDGLLVGFVNVAWDGGSHAFLLDTAVHPSVQRRGVGRRLVQGAADMAREHGVEWLHVDFAPEVREFYERCGFRPTDAGLLALAGD
jgi:GNAT superfamily N-acetyltransferase